MTNIRLVLADPKTGKCHQKAFEGEAAKPFFGLKIGDTVKGEVFDLTGYEFVIKGGTDDSGFAMRKDQDGSGKKKILAFEGVGIHPYLKKPNPKKKGMRRMNGMKQRKTIAGNTVGPNTSQINMVITKQGATPLDAPAQEPAAEEKSE